MIEAHPTVFIVDDDPAMRESLEGPTCLILDVRLPGQSGPEFQRELSAAHIRLPIIFITGHADIDRTSGSWARSESASKR